MNSSVPDELERGRGREEGEQVPGQGSTLVHRHEHTLLGHLAGLPAGAQVSFSQRQNNISCLAALGT